MPNLAARVAARFGATTIGGVYAAASIFDDDVRPEVAELLVGMPDDQAAVMACALRRRQAVVVARPDHPRRDAIATFAYANGGAFVESYSAPDPPLVHVLTPLDDQPQEDPTA